MVEKIDSLKLYLIKTRINEINKKKLDIDFKITFENLLTIFKTDIKLAKKILVTKFKYYNNILLKSPLLSDLFLFVPLVNSFNTMIFKEDIKKFCNQYSFHGKPGNRILIGNIILPHPEISPIPFKFVYKYNDKIYNKNSNIFYYEIEVCKKDFRESWDNKTISIGFGSYDVPLFNNQVGWSTSCRGYHSDDGNIYMNNVQIETDEKYTNGDIIGAGIIYKNRYNYEIFFTKNGNLVKNNIFLETKNALTIMLGLDYPAAIFTNFGEKNFKYNPCKNISAHVISTKNSFVYNSFTKIDYEFEITKKLFIPSSYINSKIKEINKSLTFLINNETNVDDIDVDDIDIDIDEGEEEEDDEVFGFGDDYTESIEEDIDEDIENTEYMFPPELTVPLLETDLGLEIDDESLQNISELFVNNITNQIYDLLKK